MLKSECSKYAVEIMLDCAVERVEKRVEEFVLHVSDNKTCHAKALAVATGGPSIPKMGATGWGYDIAKQFGLEVIDPRPALVPLTLGGKTLEELQSLSGISLEAVVRCGELEFREGLLFTHRGLSGPVILQISSYWQEGESITINLLPDCKLVETLRSHNKSDIQSILATLLPKRLAYYFCDRYGYSGKIAELSNRTLEAIADTLCGWQILPSGTEGYRTAEVTLGGVDTSELSSQTFESKKIPGLYFIGEVVDVTGHLGGFNFQWAWASGFCAGNTIG